MISYEHSAYAANSQRVNGSSICNSPFTAYFAKLKIMKLPSLPFKEKFFIIELLPEKRRGVVVSLDKEKNIKLVDVYEDVRPKELSRWLTLNPLRKKVIVAAHPSLALTVTVPIKLSREEEHFEEQIGSVELENLLAQAMIKVYNQYREPASKTLGIEELDTILVGNRVSNFRVDGHRVLNPLGFTGKQLQAVLELTLTTREIFDDWKDFFNGTHPFFFTELARAILVGLQKMGSLPVYFFLAETRGSSLFILDKAAIGTMMYRRKIDWRSDHVIHLIAETYNVSIRVAQKLYTLYLVGETSLALARALAKTMKPAVDSLHDLVARTKVRGTLFTYSSVPLPFTLPKKNGRVVFDKLPLGFLRGKLGFTTDAAEWEKVGRDPFRTLAPFVEFYYDKSDSSVNHWLKRRLHWLAPTP